MSTIQIDRNGTPVTFQVLTRAQDETVFINTTEHSNGNPSMLTLRRRLPDYSTASNGTLRVFTTRRKWVTIDAGTEMERKAQVIVKTEASIPVGTPTSDVTDLVDDTQGLLGHTLYGSAVSTGLISV